MYCGGSASDHWEAQSPLSVTAAKRTTVIRKQTIRCSTLAAVSYLYSPEESLWYTFHIIQTLSHLENPNWELWGGGSGEPETEVRVWLGEILKGLL